MRFRASLQLNGKTATGIRVPDETVASLGPGKRPSVRVTINGYTYRSTVATMGGVYMIPVSAEVRERAGIDRSHAEDCATRALCATFLMAGNPVLGRRKKVVSKGETHPCQHM
jgi:hypothetical protein